MKPSKPVSDYCLMAGDANRDGVGMEGTENYIRRVVIKGGKSLAANGDTLCLLVELYVNNRQQCNCFLCNSGRVQGDRRGRSGGMQIAVFILHCRPQ